MRDQLRNQGRALWVLLCTYRCQDCNTIIDFESLDLVDFRSRANHAREHGNDEKHQCQDLDEWALVGVCDDSLRGTHVGVDTPSG